jgi:hypothetical protein
MATRSTFHSDKTRTVSKKWRNKEKHVSVYDYNQHMGGVVKKDQLQQMYLVKWKRMNETPNATQYNSTECTDHLQTQCW